MLKDKYIMAFTLTSWQGIPEGGSNIPESLLVILFSLSVRISKPRNIKKRSRCWFEMMGRGIDMKGYREVVPHSVISMAFFLLVVFQTFYFSVHFQLIYGELWEFCWFKLWFRTIPNCMSPLHIIYLIDSDRSYANNRLFEETLVQVLSILHWLWHTSRLTKLLNFCAYFLVCWHGGNFCFVCKSNCYLMCIWVMHLW